MFTRKLTALLLAAIISIMLVPFYAFAENSGTEASDTVSQEVSEESREVGTPGEELTVTVSCGNGGDYTLESTEGSRPPKHEYYYITGDAATLTVNPSDGYLVDTVTVDGKEISPADGKYTFTVTANHSVVITFKQVTTYTIIVDCVDTDGAPVDGAYFKVNGVSYNTNTARFEENTDFTIEFFAKPGYVIKQTRYFTGTRYMDIDNPHEDKLVENTGYLVVVEALNTFEANFSVGENGSVLLNGNVASGKTVIPQGIESTLTFVPDDGYEVDKVVINGEEAETTGNRYTFTPKGDITVSVTFKEKIDYCKITLSIGNGGSITVKDDVYEIENKKYIYVPVGESITLVFAPHINYELNTVKVSGKAVKLNEDNEYTIECTDTAATVSATFRSTEAQDIFYTITAFVSGGGTISPAGANEVEEGGKITFTITANEGFEIYSVTVDGKDVTLTGGKYTIENVSANMVISATFKKATVPDSFVTVEDIDWTAETIVVDVTEKVNVSTEIFQRAASNYPEKKILINDSEFSILIPGGGVFKPEGDTVSFEFMRNGSPNFVAVQDAVSAEHAGASFVTVYCTAPALPAGTVLELFLGAEFSGADLAPIEYLSGALNSVGETVNADEKGWVSLNYYNQKDLVFVEVSEDKFTLTITYNTESGTVTPSGTIKTDIGEVKTINVTPNEGCKVAKVTLDGSELDIAEDGVYTVTMDANHTFTVIFEAPSSVNVGLIIALVIIAIAVVGGATVFVLRWRKNQF